MLTADDKPKGQHDAGGKREERIEVVINFQKAEANDRIDEINNHAHGQYTKIVGANDCDADQYDGDGKQLAEGFSKAKMISSKDGE